MKRNQARALALALLAAGGAAIAIANSRGGEQRPELSAQPQLETIQLVEAVPFTLASPNVHTFRAETPSYTEGYLLVLRTNPDNLVPRQTLEHVLYVGDEVAERVNVGEGSGHVVAIVPGPVDLANAPIFFGAPELPERVDRTMARAELSQAVAMGVRGVGATALAEVLQAPQVVEDGYELHWLASMAIERYAPDEADLVKSLRAPRIGR